MLSIANKVRQVRKAKKISQEKLAIMSNIFLLNKKILKNRRNFIAFFRKRAGILGYSIAEMKASQKNENMQEYYFLRK